MGHSKGEQRHANARGLKRCKRGRPGGSFAALMGRLEDLCRIEGENKVVWLAEGGERWRQAAAAPHGVDYRLTTNPVPHWAFNIEGIPASSRACPGRQTAEPADRAAVCGDLWAVGLLPREWSALQQVSTERRSRRQLSWVQLTSATKARVGISRRGPPVSLCGLVQPQTTQCQCIPLAAPRHRYELCMLFTPHWTERVVHAEQSAHAPGCQGHAANPEHGVPPLQAAAQRWPKLSFAQPTAPDTSCSSLRGRTACRQLTAGGRGCRAANRALVQAARPAAP